MSTATLGTPTFDHWLDRVRGSVSCAPYDHYAIAQRCADAEASGNNAAVWHQSAIHFDRPCQCFACRPARHQVRS